MPLAHRNLLVDIIPKLLPLVGEFNALLATIGHGDVVHRVPAQASYNIAVSFVVQVALEERWEKELSAALLKRFPNREELKVIDAAIAAQQPLATAAQPADEALLAGDRPFVNRIDLRTKLRRLIDPAGDSVLLIDGNPKTGKSFTFYLLDHVGTRHGFFVHQFKLSQAPPPRQLAEDIVKRLLGDPAALPDQKNESAERWAEGLPTRSSR